MQSTLKKRLFGLIIIASATLLASNTYAQSMDPDADSAQDPWDNVLSTDRPGFADSSAAAAPRELILELGLLAEKPASADFGAALSLATRFGLYDGVELRVRIPSFGFVLDPTSDTLAMSFNAVEAGIKLSIPFHSKLRVALVPYIAIPPSDISATSLAGPGAGLSAIVDIGLVGTLNLTLFATPKWNQYKGPGGSDSVFELDSSVMLSGSLTRRMSLFAEVIGVKPGLGDFYMGGDCGLLYYFTPDTMMDMSAGISLQDNLAAFGMLGFSYRI